MNVYHITNELQAMMGWVEINYSYIQTIIIIGNFPEIFPLVEGEFIRTEK